MNQTIAGKLIVFTFTVALAGTGLVAQAHAGADGDVSKRGEWMLKKLDRNQDGVIDREEHRAPFARHFAAFDANGDGSVTEAEFMAHADKGFEKMDADGDGKLNADEMRQSRHDRMMLRKSHGDMPRGEKRGGG